MSVAVLSSLLLAGAGLPAADAAAVAARVKDIFAPYALPANARSPWDRPLFSRETAALIAHWKRVQPKDEPDALNDGDWFCLCQDYDRATFRVSPGAPRLVRAGVVEVPVRVALGGGEVRSERLTLVKEASGWRLDDLVATPDFPRGLKQKLRDTIAEDEAL